MQVEASVVSQMFLEGAKDRIDAASTSWPTCVEQTRARIITMHGLNARLHRAYLIFFGLRIWTAKPQLVLVLTT